MRDDREQRIDDRTDRFLICPPSSVVRSPLFACVLALERVLPAEQTFVGGHERGAMHDGGGRYETIGGILVELAKFSRRNRDLAVDWNFRETRRQQPRAKRMRRR